METQLQEVIEKIKSNGIRKAENLARDILKQAEEKASYIVGSAEKEAKRVISQAETEAKRMTESGQASLRQAGRDLLIQVRQEIGVLFSRLIRTEVCDKLDDAMMIDVLKTLLTGWGGDPTTTEVLLSKEQWKRMETTLRVKLKDLIAKGVTFNPVEGIDAGFRIALQGEDLHYDFSDQEIAAMIACHLNPRLAILMEGREET